VKVYSYSEARQQLASLLNYARREGEVRIRRHDGQLFVVKPTTEASKSPLDVPGIDVRATTADVLAAVGESRRSTARLLKGVSPSRVPERRSKPKGSGSNARKGTGNR